MIGKDRFVYNMWTFAYMIILTINFKKGVSSNSIPSPMNIKEDSELYCKSGTLLSTSVCIPNGYLKGEVPEKPTKVNAKIEINNIREVDDKKMRITLDFYQELTWMDNRIITRFLTNPFSVLNNNLIDYIWKPDLWIKNLFDFKLHNVLDPTGGLIIMEKEDCPLVMNCTMPTETKRNTVVVYNMEALATIYCNFDFLNYPMDTQQCEFLMDGSYPYPNVVDISFDVGLFGVTNENSNIDDFEIEVTFKYNINTTGIHSVIKLERKILPFLIKYYLPCIAIIIVSLLSFLISMDSIPARVGLLVTQFLTLTNILIAQQVIILNGYS